MNSYQSLHGRLSNGVYYWRVNDLPKFKDPVKKYMSDRLVFVSPTATLAQVAEMMAKEDTDIAIVKSGKNYAGIITDSDIFMAMKSYVFKDEVENLPEDAGKVKIVEIMRGTLSKEFMNMCELTGLRPCLMLGEEETVENAIKTMGKAGSHHILVIGADGSIVGTLSAHDLLKSFTE
jgi:CBS domain-containing protein